MANVAEYSIGPQQNVFLLRCRSCDLPTMALWTHGKGHDLWPTPHDAYSDDIPLKARKAMEDARTAIGTPSLSIVGSARAVDYMLKERGYKEGSLHGRIKKAAEEHLITAEMAQWAHEVRLEANIERHADEDEPDATLDDAQRVLEFAEALAEFLFELPARVARGRSHEQPPTE